MADSERCAASMIPPDAIPWYRCVLPRGHRGEHWGDAQHTHPAAVEEKP